MNITISNECIAQLLSLRLLLSQDLRETLEQELDFLHEGHNGERCRDELKGLPYIHVPKVYWGHCSKVRVGFTYIHVPKVY